MKNIKRLTTLSIMGSAILVVFLFTGCMSRLGGKSVDELQMGDTIFISVAGEYVTAVVVVNYTEHKIIAIRRANIFDSRETDLWVYENYSYRELRWGLR